MFENSQNNIECRAITNKCCVISNTWLIPHLKIKYIIGTAMDLSLKS